MPIEPLAELRTICLALPEATEKLTWEETPTFRVREKIFAMQAGGDGRPSLWCKAPPGAQQILVGADPTRFFVPPYVGRNGWIGVHLDVGPDWEEIAGFVLESYRMTAPRRLTKLLPAPSA
ncbi:MAG TPA: MmcQ/YjbR family DNA-binding protein [Dehalococcoidia bacterium]|nr:MmcQ/YjbR family DNA-binding protein [Dehalococcoidia bacterium]